MLETSKDLLYVAVSVAVAGLALFTCWAIFYTAMILRQLFKTIREMRERFYKVDGMIDTIQEKIDHSTSYLLLIGEGVKKLVEVAKNYSDKKGKRGRKKKK